MAVKIPGSITSINTHKKGTKITFFIDSEDRQKALGLDNFLDKEITIEVLVNRERQLEKMEQITPAQRGYIYSIIKEIANHSGMGNEEAKVRLKDSFYKATGIEFSLSNCDNDTAALFIDYLITTAFTIGMAFKENPSKYFDTMEKYIEVCNRNKKCVVCGGMGEIHHIDTIGMGRDRKTVDDSDYKKVCLCRIHHSEVHNIGLNKFSEKYHLKGLQVE